MRAGHRMEKKKTRVVGNTVFLLKYALRFAPGYFWSVVLFGAYSEIEEFLEFTYCIKYLVDVIQFGGSFGQAAGYMLFVAALVLAKLVFGAFYSNAIVPKGKEKLQRRMREELYEKAVALDISRYDDPECYNEFVFSVSEIGVRMDELMRNMEKLSRCAAGIVVTGIFTLSLDSVGFVFVLVSFLLAFLFNNLCGRLQFEKDRELNPMKRKRGYFGRVFYLSDYAKELRLNPIAAKLEREFHENNVKMVPVIKKYGKKQIWLLTASGWLADSFLMDVCYLGYLLYRVMAKGAFSLGSMLGLYSAAQNMKDNLKIMAALLPKFRESSFYVDKIREFLSFQEELEGGILDASKEPFESLEIRNVSFGYQNDKDVIHEAGLRIESGEKIAIVGYNGAGKTTLIKLLMRLYDVREGKILLNGRDVREYETGSYRRLFGTVFQDYRLYGATLAENVRMDTEPSAGEEGDKDNVREALIQSGFEKKLGSLANGLETNLTREFDDAGVNLSGGEAQKVAIARAFYKGSPVIIMDEPSSALDPVSEYYLNEAMMRAAEHKAVIFISHRLSTARMADRIYMFEQGRVIESGSHEELMQRNGKYAQMYRVQAEKYREPQQEFTFDA